MDCARSGYAPPVELKLAWWCGDGRLPDAGGVLDQDCVLWGRMQALSGFYNLAVTIAGSHGESIHRLTASQRIGWRYLIEEGIW